MKLNLVATLLLSLPLAAPLWLYTHAQQQRPPRQDTTYPLFHGIDYHRSIQTAPRPLVIHRVTINLFAEGIQPMVTPAELEWAEEVPQKSAIDQIILPKIAMSAQTTREFVATFDLQLGINANYFYEFEEKTPWQFYPHKGDWVYAIGEAIAPPRHNLNGSATRYGAHREDWPALCFGFDHHASIEPDGTCPDSTQYGIAGRDLLVQSGKALTQFPHQSQDKPYARVAVGLDAHGQTLEIVVVDGKQPYYSEGMLLEELATWLEQRGVDGAIALDGGGSSTLVITLGSEAILQNAPIHGKWPMGDRPIANHLGFYALPATP